MNSKSLILALVFACIVGVCGGLYFKSITKKTFSETSAPTGIPVTINIPSIHVHAHSEAVGLDQNNLMDVPVNTNDVAWYKLGPEPGEIGNAVIDGHVDTQTGAPAVFANLGEIKVGDTMTIIEQQQVTHTFMVTSVESLPAATFPTTRVFGTATEAHLNLITCDGIWDKKASNYSKRLVVFSKLVK